MKLHLPEALLTQPVETSAGQVEGLPLQAEQLDPILAEAVESQPEQRAEPEPAPPAPTPQKPTTSATPAPVASPARSNKALPILGLALAAGLAIVAAATQQGSHGKSPAAAQPGTQPTAPTAPAGNRGIIWE